MTDAVVSVRRVSILALVSSARPERPACYDSDDDWQAWLVQAHRTGTRIVRRADRVDPITKERHAPYVMLKTSQIPYCLDCTERRSLQMQQSGRCFPCDFTALENASGAHDATCTT